MQGPGSPPLFVGRAHELDRLQRAFEAAVAGHGSLALLAGEPGIGKTSVCRELAARVSGRGGLETRAPRTARSEGRSGDLDDVPP